MEVQEEEEEVEEVLVHSDQEKEGPAARTESDARNPSTASSKPVHGNKLAYGANSSGRRSGSCVCDMVLKLNRTEI